MSMKIHPVAEFYAVSLGSATEDLVAFAQDSLVGPVTMQTLYSGAGTAAVALQSAPVSGGSYVNVSGMSLTGLKPGTLNEVSSNVRGRVAKIVGSGNGMMFIWLTKPSNAYGSLSTRTK